MSELIKARWVAGFPAVMADGTQLVPGETVAKIPAEEANASDNWEILAVEKPAKPKPAALPAPDETETTAPEGS